VGGYVEANGLEQWCEVLGSHDAEPVLLLHGGFEHGETWAPQTAALADHYRLIVPDRRGHGRTSDVDGPITYDSMRDDTIALLEALGAGPVHVVGYSDGANVAMLLAIARPDLVRRVVLIAGNFHHDGVMPELFDMIAAPESEAMLRTLYDPVSPDGPDHFPVVRDKLLRMWREEPALSERDLASISAPTLVLAGDDDLVTHEHLVAQHRSIPDSRLAIVPGASHGVPMERPDLVNAMLLEFLSGAMDRPTFFPVRRNA
jgi:pimeloyl-ACP methyl ester carboxylesterase